MVHLRFLLLYSTLAFSFSRCVAYARGARDRRVLLVKPRTIGTVTFDVNSLLYSAMAILIGFQSITFALFTKIFAISEGLLPEDPRLNRLFQWITLEVGLVVGSVIV
jgi:hypothetical protein